MNQQYDPQITKEELLEIKPGYVIERMLAFVIPCYFTVTEVKDGIISAGEPAIEDDEEKAVWTFDINTGLEIDNDIPTIVSYIRRAWPSKEAAMADAKEGLDFQANVSKIFNDRNKTSKDEKE